MNVSAYVYVCKYVKNQLQPTNERIVDRKESKESETKYFTLRVGRLDKGDKAIDKPPSERASGHASNYHIRRAGMAPDGIYTTLYCLYVGIGPGVIFVFVFGDGRWRGPEGQRRGGSSSTFRPPWLIGAECHVHPGDGRSSGHVIDATTCSRRADMIRKLCLRNDSGLIKRVNLAHLEET